MRSLVASVGALVLALGLAGAVGVHLRSRVQAAAEAVLREEGRVLYARARRTEVGYRPYKLLHELYARAEDKPTVLRYLDIQPGQTAADVGCGAGYFTLDMARAVGPTGRVFALDVQESAVAFLQERLGLIGCPGCGPIQTWVNTVDNAQLPESAVDVELLANLDFYCFNDLLPVSRQMLQSCLLGLKPGGRAVVVQDMSVNSKGREEYIQANFEEAGFVTVDRFHFEEPSVLFVFQRPAR